MKWQRKVFSLQNLWYYSDFALAGEHRLEQVGEKYLKINKPNVFDILFKGSLVISSSSWWKSILTLTIPDYYPFQCWGYFRLKHRDAKIFRKSSKPCHVGIHWITRWVLSDEYLCARVLVISEVFASFCIAKSATCSIRVNIYILFG